MEDKGKKEELINEVEEVENEHAKISENEKQECSDNKLIEDYEKLKNSFQRLQADFTNYKRRQENEKADIYKFSTEKLVLKVLPVLDNLERAINDIKEENTFTDGVKLIKNDLEKVLKDEGLEEIDSTNQKFDANLHHAVFMEDSDEVESEYIIETFQKGYKLNEKVIRPAMVKVAK